MKAEPEKIDFSKVKVCLLYTSSQPGLVLPFHLRLLLLQVRLKLFQYDVLLFPH